MEEALVKFEQDYDYEKWLEEEVEPIVMKENLMRVESLDIKGRSKSRDARGGLVDEFGRTKLGGWSTPRTGWRICELHDGWLERVRSLSNIDQTCTSDRCMI